MEEPTIDYKISAILANFKKRGTFDKKADVLNLVMSLKTSLEFNTNIDWEKMCNELGHIYNDPSPIYQRADYTPNDIDPNELNSNDIVVFGSNTEGRHGKGMAKFVKDYCGAVYGQARGIQGNSYAIVTKDLKIGEKSIELSDIGNEIQQFLEFAHSRPDLTFLMTKIGCNLAGYTIQDIAPLFANKVIPQNVLMPKEFVDISYWYNYLYSPSKETFYNLVSENVLHIVNVETLKIEKIEIKNALQSLPKDIVQTDDDAFLTAAKHVVNSLFKTKK